MKIKNILALVCFLCIGVSCSMEDDILNDVDTKGSDISSSEVYAAVDLSLLGGSAQTKASEYPADDSEKKQDPNDNESSVWSFFVAVLDAGSDNVLTTYYCKSVQALGNHTYTISDGSGGSSHYLFKVPASQPDLKFYVVANVYDGTNGAPDNLSDLAKCTTLTALKQVSLLNVDPNILPKAGISSKLAKADYTVSATILDIDHSKCPEIQVPLTQRTARVELAGITLNGEVSEDIAVTSLKLVNRKQYGLVDGERGASVTANSTDAGWSFPLFGDDAKGVGYTTELPDYAKYDEVHFYTYENTNSSFPTKLEVTYKVGNEQAKTYTFVLKTSNIESPCIVAGHVYKLFLNVKNEMVEATVKCYTMNWKDGGTIELPLEKK